MNASTYRLRYTQETSKHFCEEPPHQSEGRIRSAATWPRPQSTSVCYQTRSDLLRPGHCRRRGYQATDGSRSNNLTG